MTFRSLISLISDIAGVASFVISIVTIILAAGIKRSINKDRTASDFEKEIDNKINMLSTFEELFLENYSSLEYIHVTKLEILLGDISTAYDGILNKNVIKSIKSLKVHLQDQYKPESRNYTQKSCHECAKRIEEVISLLKKQRRLK